MSIDERRDDAMTLDVREVTPRERHPLIFDSVASLSPGQSLRLVNDHDPKPLYYQFMAEHPGEVGWQYLEEGPDVWQVRITKLAR
ncbi:MAG TPA: DUF2249 domain-containing protein [Thermomicrobiales bacterium]|jgi:uncharacterized protein (DUF2249 family)|nr:DUF2249 domain-containing protein [Thermomicrobiales bacterium]